MTAPIQTHNICSVWRPRNQCYDYYSCPHAYLNTPKGWKNKVGTPVEDSLPRLPIGARRIGQGEQALGALASGESVWTGIPFYILGGVVLYFVGKQLMK
jgi:hypothetical protein